MCKHFVSPLSISNYQPEFNVDDWIIIIYDKVWYPGVITHMDNKGLLTVKFLKRNAKTTTFTFPTVNDIQKVYGNQI